MSTFEERRKKIFDLMEDNSLLFVFSSKAPYATADEKYPFYVNRNFYYLTNLEIENAVLVLRKTMGTCVETLFIERFDEVLAKWVGARMLPNEATKISGIQRISYIDELNDQVGSLLRIPNIDNATCYFNFEKQEYSQPDNEEQTFAKELKTKYPNIVLKNSYQILTELRLVKDESEIANMQRAIDITQAGLERVMSNIGSGKYEYQVENEFNYALLNEGCRQFAFKTIAASGNNATVLHYNENKCMIPEGSLMLFDLGASYKNYNADISRTYPVDGKFSDRQKEIYNIVLDCNKYIIENSKVGTTLGKLNQLSIEFLQKRLTEIGMLENGKTVRDYYFHSIGHMLGLDTHDVSLANYVLREGNVITVEPGLYIEEEQIGVRIEDDVLITNDGPIVLSKNIIKEVDDIEKFILNAHKI